MTVAATHVPSRSALARFATERRLAVASLGLVGLHVVDDNFLQPEPGMSATDHLAGGLVQLGLVAAAAWAYPRVRAGARGALALLFGFFGVLAGTEAAYYTFADRPSGDDFTGFLSLLGGFVLLGIGIGRSGGRGGPTTAVDAATCGAGSFWRAPFCWSGLCSSRPRSPTSSPIRAGGRPDPESGRGARGRLLHDERRAPPRRLVHPLAQRRDRDRAFPGRSGPQKHTRMLVRHGYGVLLFDRRGEGASEGDPNTFGWVGDRDLHAAPRTSAAAPTSIPSGSARSASRSAARC